MRYRSVIGVAVALALALALGGTLPAAEKAPEKAPKPDSKDAAGLGAMYARLTAAFKAGDADAVLDNVSKEAVLVFREAPDSPDGYVTVDRTGLGAWIRLALPRGGMERRYITRGMWKRPAAGDVVVIHQVSLTLAGTHQGRIDRAITMVRYEGGKWRVCLSFPDFTRPVVRVEKVLPDSQAAKLGVRAGDLVERYGRREIHAADDLPQQAQALAQAPPDHDIPLVLRRAGQRKVVQCTPGQIGVAVRTRLLGDVGTRTLTGKEARDHGAAVALRTFYSALAARDVAAAKRQVSQAGFLGFSTPRPGAPSKPETRDNFDELAPADLEEMAKQMKLETLKARDVRLIVRDSLAVVGCTVSGEVAGKEPGAGTSFEVHTLGLMAKWRGTWGVVAMIDAGESARRVGLD